MPISALHSRSDQPPGPSQSPCPVNFNSMRLPARWSNDVQGGQLGIGHHVGYCPAYCPAGGAPKGIRLSGDGEPVQRTQL